MRVRFREASHRLLVILLVLATTPRTAHAINKNAVARCTEAAENGQRLRANGELRAAAKQLAICVAHECPALVRRDCGKWLEETSDATPSLVVNVVDPDGKDIKEGQIYFDDEVLADKVDGRATSVDPGAHRVAYVNGTKRVQEDVVIREGERNRTVVIHLPGPKTVAPPPPPGPGPGLWTTPPPRPTPSPWPWVLGGAGIAAGGVGSVFWYLGSDAHASMGSTCAPTHTCKDDAVQRAHTNLVVGDILVGVGALAVTTAFIWLLTRSDPAPARAQATR
jgi:hypothetical protein